MTAEAPPSLRSRVLGATVAVVLAAGILFGGYVWISRGPGIADRPEPGAVLVSTRLALPAAGAATRFRLPAPGRLEFALDLHAASSVKVSLGPPRIPVPSEADAPDPANSVTWTAKAGDPPHIELLYAAGAYVLHFEPAGGAATTVGVTVRSVASH